MTTLEIAVRAEVAPRTARAHAWKLARLGVADFVEVFPGRRYRIAEPNENNQNYIDQLTKAEEALGSQGHRGISATRGAIPRR